MSPSMTINGNVVFADGVRAASIRMSGDSIDAVTPIEGIVEDNILIFPGFFDIHVHAREYPKPLETDERSTAIWEKMLAKETFLTAGNAAINGGVTLFGAMPNDPCPPDNANTYTLKQEIAAQSRCPVITYAAITGNSDPWEDLPYKVYLDAKSSSVAFDHWPDLEGALSRYKGCRVFFHAENPEVLRKFPSSEPRWLSRPPEAEETAVDKILNLTAKYQLKTHICHISTQQSVQLINSFNESASRRVTCEVTPHHLFFSVQEGQLFSAIPGATTPVGLMGSNPPLRSEAERRFLVHTLKEGLVDALASDHAPHTLQDKFEGSPGVPHLDTLGPFVGWLFNECGFPATRIAEILSANPGKIFERDTPRPFGEIREHWTASLSLIDMGGTTTIRGSEIGGRTGLKTKCGWSPFSGVSLPASVAGVVINGRRFA